MSQENAELIGRAYEAMGAGDFDRLTAMFDHDVVWDQTGVPKWPEEPVLHGRENVRRSIGGWLAAWESLGLQLLDLRWLDDERALGHAVWRGRGRASGWPLELEQWQIIYARDGRIVRIANYSDEAGALKDADRPATMGGAGFEPA